MQIIVDTREKKPLWTPGKYKDFEVISRKLAVGDYAINGLEHLLCIERKASASELFGNFTRDRKRLFAEIDRMQDVKLRFIVIEEELDTLLNPKSYIFARGRKRIAPAIVVGSLISLMALHGVQIQFVGNSGRKFIKRLLLKIYEYYNKGMLDVD